MTLNKYNNTINSFSIRFIKIPSLQQELVSSTFDRCASKRKIIILQVKKWNLSLNDLLLTHTILEFFC